MDLTIVNGRVLLPDGALVEAAVLEAPPSNGARLWDAGGGLVLPGMVDLHGDAFERQLMPRPETPFPVDVALMGTDRQLIANGITTAYYGITYSWEPGLRGRDHAIEILDTIEALRPRFLCDTRVHLRWEVYNLDAEDEVADWLSSGRIDLLAFNDHLDHILRRIGNAAKLERYLDRTQMPAGAFVERVDSLKSRSNEVPGAVDRLAASARAHGVVMALHDDETPEMRRRYNGIGCCLCEFPLDRATADASIELGDPIILGAPNMVRDGSHCDRLHAASSVGDGRCQILTSDYFYPSLLQAVFILVQCGHADLATAWRLVSTTPAAAAGLADRGEIAPGRRADLVVVDDSPPGLPWVTGTFVAGRPIHAGHA